MRNSNITHGAGLTGMVLIASFLVAGSTSNIMLEDVDRLNQEMETIANDVLEEIMNYLKIEDVVGKYYYNGTVKRVEKIVLTVKQYINNPINISELKIEVSNDEDVIIKNFYGKSFKIDSYTLFQHIAWESLKNNTFGVLVTGDKDRSILDHNIMNDEPIYILIPLPEQFKMGNKESMSISIIPNNGIATSTYIETPSFHTKNIISFS